MSKTKEYSKGELTVVWKPDLCYHSGNCVKGLPSVFKPDEKPWIQVDGATADAIMAQVDNCPSGALSYYLGTKDEEEHQPFRAQVAANGPVILTGKVEIEMADGSKKVMEKCALCRCGASDNKPFCDGSHKKVDFQG